MVALYIFLGALTIIGAAVAMIYYLDSCTHNWVLIEKGKIYHTTYPDFKREIGIYKFYECEHCKKMKKETLNIEH